jgi:nitrate reductase NapE component
MEPKFQSSFIPKGLAASNTQAGSVMGRKREEKSLFSFLSVVIFIISIFLALGMFGYKFYLKYRIEAMSVELEEARVAVEPEIIRELTRLDNRIVSTRDLINKHLVLTPVFEFLETSTPKALRFNEFRYTKTDKGMKLSMRGEARGYATLALESDILDKSQYFRDSRFSDLNLSDRGDVSFSFAATIDSTLLK